MYTPGWPSVSPLHDVLFLSLLSANSSVKGFQVDCCLNAVPIGGKYMKLKAISA